MKNKVMAGIFFIFLSAIFLLAPINTAWGGWSWQTVPTIGPSRTPTASATVTRTSTATSWVPATLTFTLQPGANTAVPTIASSATQTATESVAIPITPTGLPSMTVVESSSTLPVIKQVTLTLIFNPTPDATVVVPIGEELPGGPPIWLLPLTCSLGLVILIVLLRLFIKRRTRK